MQNPSPAGYLSELKSELWETALLCDLGKWCTTSAMGKSEHQYPSESHSKVCSCHPRLLKKKKKNVYKDEDYCYYYSKVRVSQVIKVINIQLVFLAGKKKKDNYIYNKSYYTCVLGLHMQSRLLSWHCDILLLLLSSWHFSVSFTNFSPQTPPFKHFISLIFSRALKW